ncbi:MAG: Gfo/Idh/MocA family protein [Elusimicrobiota bacterium]
MNCLIFGYGYMGKIRQGVLAQHSDVNLVDVYDPSVDPVKSKLNSNLLPADLPINWDKYDAVFVCTPNNVTANLAVQALKNKKHVFCEKPPGRNWEDFCQIYEAALENVGKRIVFGFNHRLHPSIQVARSMIGEGGLGKIIYMKGTYGKSGGNKYRESWRNKKDVAGGGILLDQGIHMLDIFLSILGPCDVQDAILNDAFWKCGVEDNAFILLKSQKGVPAFLHSSATLWKHTFKFEIGCENGYLVASGLLSKTGSYGREQLIIGKRQFEDEAFALGNPREEIIHFDRDESWDNEVNEFIAAIKENRPATHGTLDEARGVMQIIHDVYSKKKIFVNG